MQLKVILKEFMLFLIVDRVTCMVKKMEKAYNDVRILKYSMWPLMDSLEIKWN